MYTHSPVSFVSVALKYCGKFCDKQLKMRRQHNSPPSQVLTVFTGCRLKGLTGIRLLLHTSQETLPTCAQL